MHPTIWGTYIMAPRHGLPHIGAPPTSLRPIARARVLGIERKRGRSPKYSGPKMRGCGVAPLGRIGLLLTLPT